MTCCLPNSEPSFIRAIKPSDLSVYFVFSTSSIWTCQLHHVLVNELLTFNHCQHVLIVKSLILQIKLTFQITRQCYNGVKQGNKTRWETQKIRPSLSLSTNILRKSKCTTGLQGWRGRPNPWNNSWKGLLGRKDSETWTQDQIQKTIQGQVKTITDQREKGEKDKHSKQRHRDKRQEEELQNQTGNS